MSSNAQSWLVVNGTERADIASEIEQSVRNRIAAGDFKIENVRYLSEMHLALAPQGLEMSEKRLEKLRRLCQLWDVDIRSTQVTSHRPVIGPIIVKMKQLLYPILRVFLKDFIRQQRAFNAAAIALISDIGNEKKAENREPRS